MVVGSFPFRRRLFFAVVLGIIAALVAPSWAVAAVVQAVRAAGVEGGTRIVVEIDGPFRYRTRTSEDGGSLLIDIADANLATDVLRFLPVATEQVDGVIVLEDATARIVRVSVDAAGQGVPALRTAVGPRGLEVNLGGTAPVASAVGSQASSWSPSVRSDVRSDVRSAPSRRAVLERRLVVLDPGHGGKDPGARAWTGEYEKDIVLDLAERVARRLREPGDIDVVMTRSGDRYVTLEDRRDTSRRWNADVFVSIHANASPSAKARGVETYYHPRSSGLAGDGRPDREARRLARIENGGRVDVRRSHGRPGLTPASTGTSGPPAYHGRDAVRLAELVQSELVRRLGMRYETVRDLGAKEGPFFVIGENAAPSVLVEAAFLTHREEGLRMRSEVFREQIADGVARGIRAFLDEQQPGAL